MGLERIKGFPIQLKPKSSNATSIIEIPAFVYSTSSCPIQAVASCRQSDYLAKEPDVKRMIDLAALSSMLSTSQLFRDLRSYTTTHEEFSALKDLWELFTTLGLYYSGTDLLKSYCEDDRYRSFLQHLVAKPANMLSNPELASLNLRYGW